MKINLIFSYFTMKGGGVSVFQIRSRKRPNWTLINTERLFTGQRSKAWGNNLERWIEKHRKLTKPILSWVSYMDHYFSLLKAQKNQFKMSKNFIFFLNDVIKNFLHGNIGFLLIEKNQIQFWCYLEQVWSEQVLVWICFFSIPLKYNRKIARYLIILL